MVIFTLNVGDRMVVGVWRTAPPTLAPHRKFGAEPPKAKQINILGSRQHPAEKVALWCDFFYFFFFKRGQIAGYSYAYKYVFNGVWAI